MFLAFNLLLLYLRVKSKSKDQNNLKQLTESLFNANNGDDEAKQIELDNQIDRLNERIVEVSVKTCRLWTYAATAISILGVDFRIYPRHLAKTERFGISFMDVGVGLFIMCHSMKVIRSASKPTTASASESEASTTTNNKHILNMTLRMMQSLKNSLPLIILGLGRLVSVKASKYVEHESEYGVHWNFFFTIVVIKFLASGFEYYFERNSLRYTITGLVVSFYYQYLLVAKNFTGFLLDNDAQKRATSLLYANKEGLFSCLGYLGIYLISHGLYIQIGNILNEK